LFSCFASARYFRQPFGKAEKENQGLATIFRFE